MTGGIHEVAALGFARTPELYERGRPGYPPAAVAQLVAGLRIGPGSRVLDLAAGTGKLTRALLPTGAELLAVEPVAEMRAALERSAPDVAALAGTAEAIPLPKAEVDAVVAAQAFHWFRGDEALAEIHRVLRPGGRLGLAWNLRDETEPWVARLTEIMEAVRGSAPRPGAEDWQEAFRRTALFSPLERASFQHAQRLSPDDVVARVGSVSFVAALPAPAREDVAARVRDLLASDPGTRGRAVVELRYRTDVYWCERLPVTAGAARP